MSNPPENASSRTPGNTYGDGCPISALGLPHAQAQEIASEKGAVMCALEVPNAPESPNSTYTSEPAGGFVFKIWQKSLMVTQVRLI